MDRQIVKMAYKVELDLTTAQRRWCERACAVTRVTYNWGLSEWQRWYRWQKICDAGKRDKALGYLRRWGAAEPDFAGKPTAFGIHARLTKEKQGALAWIGEIENAYVPREAIAALGKAYSSFFRRLGKHRAGDHSECGQSARGRCSLGAPRFHAKRPDEGFCVDQGSALQSKAEQRASKTKRGTKWRSSIRVPGLGWIDAKPGQRLPAARFDSKAAGRPCTCDRPTGARSKHKKGCMARNGAWLGDPGVEICGLGIRRWGGRWYASLRVRAPAPVTREREPEKRLAVEVGVRYRAVAYDGQRFGVFADTRTDARILQLELRRKLWERRQDRRYQATKSKWDQTIGWREARAQVAKLHRQIAQVRADRIHHVSRALVDSAAGQIVVRDMAVKGLLQRGTASDPRVRNILAHDVQAAGMAELRRQISYKQDWAGGSIELVPKEEPETKRCWACGAVRDSAPGYPWFVCQKCGHSADRDINAAQVRYDQRTASADPVGCPGTPGGQWQPGPSSGIKASGSGPSLTGASVPGGEPLGSDPSPGNGATAEPRGEAGEKGSRASARLTQSGDPGMPGLFPFDLRSNRERWQ